MLRALGGDFAWSVLAVAHGQVSPFSGKPRHDPVLQEWSQTGAASYVQLFATPIGREDDENRDVAFRTVQQFTLEVLATNTKRAVATFEYDPAKIPALRRLI
jgi:hypothetical protein